MGVYARGEKDMLASSERTSDQYAEHSFQRGDQQALLS